MVIMNTYQISITELKNNISEVVNMVHFNKKTAYIERHNKVVAKLVPVEDKPDSKERKQAYKKIESFFGAIPDFPDVTKSRRSSRRFK
jgi:antitoxin (DNA-binding transcriptional repressor) of toxin-antitoxin stability system